MLPSYWVKSAISVWNTLKFDFEVGREVSWAGGLGDLIQASFS